MKNFLQQFVLQTHRAQIYHYYYYYYYYCVCVCVCVCACRRRRTWAELRRFSRSWMWSLKTSFQHCVTSETLFYSSTKSLMATRSKCLKTCVCVCVCVRSRVGVYVNTFQGLAGHQEKFHKEMGKVRQTVHVWLIKLIEPISWCIDQSAIFVCSVCLLSSAKTWTTSWPNWKSSGSWSKWTEPSFQSNALDLKHLPTCRTRE